MESLCGFRSNSPKGFLADPTPCDKARSLVGIEIKTGKDHYDFR